MGVFSFLSKKTQDPAGEPDIPVRPRRSRATAQDEEPIDPMLPEKKRARRRLIGATALVLAAIIGLPMVFDSEPKPLADDISIQIPPRDKPQGEPSNPMPLPPEQQEPVKMADKPTVTADKPIAEADKTTAVPMVDTPPVRIDQVADSVNVAEKQADKPSNSQADKPADKPQAKPTEADKGRFVVQVAAVANKAKAEELQNRLKKAGFKVYLQKVATKDGERFRVRVGPVSSRDEADRIRARLGKMGLNGTVQPA